MTFWRHHLGYPSVFFLARHQQSVFLYQGDIALFLYQQFDLYGEISDTTTDRGNEYEEDQIDTRVISEEVTGYLERPTVPGTPDRAPGP